MKLYVNGQDITRLILADIEDRSSLVQYTSQPDAFLRTLNMFLEERGNKLGDIEEAYVVVGPGSSTSLRTIVTIFNVFAFTYKIALFALKKEKNEQDDDFIKTIQEKKIKSLQINEHLTPIYESDPNITESSRDALKRKKW